MFLRKEMSGSVPEGLLWEVAFETPHFYLANLTLPALRGLHAQLTRPSSGSPCLPVGSTPQTGVLGASLPKRKVKERGPSLLTVAHAPSTLPSVSSASKEALPFPVLTHPLSFSLGAESLSGLGSRPND